MLRRRWGSAILLISFAALASVQALPHVHRRHGEPPSAEARTLKTANTYAPCVLCLTHAPALALPPASTVFAGPHIQTQESLDGCLMGKRAKNKAWSSRAPPFRQLLA